MVAAKRAEQVPAEDAKRAEPIVSTIIDCNTEVHGLIRSVPRTLADVHALHVEFGRDLASDLRAKLRAWHRSDAPLASHLLIISRFPKSRTEGREPEAIDVWAFLCDTVEAVGVAVGAWQKSGGVVGALINGAADDQLLKDIKVDVLNTAFELSRSRAAIANGESATELQLVAIGAGALGSQLIADAVRSGFGKWTIIDNDVLLPHNCARHELTVPYVGHPKAEALAHHCNQILAATGIARGIVADVMNPRGAAQAVSKALSEADVIGDFSASVAVARHLALLEAPCRRISIFLSPSGRDLVVLAEDAARAIPIDHLEMQYYRLVIEQPALTMHMKPPPGRIQYAQSCRDASAVVPHDSVAMHAALGARALRTALASPDASITVWAASETGLNRVSASPRRTFSEVMGEWTVVWDQALEDAVRAWRDERLPRETGGVLLGVTDTTRKRVYVVSALSSPPDSVEWPTMYIRGAQGLADRVREVDSISGGTVEYVGEWHSHPRGASASASGTDQAAMKDLAARMGVDGLPALLLIVADAERRWFMASLGV